MAQDQASPEMDQHDPHGECVKGWQSGQALRCQVCEMIGECLVVLGQADIEGVLSEPVGDLFKGCGIARSRGAGGSKALRALTRALPSCSRGISSQLKK